MDYLTSAQKAELFAKYGKSKSDTGSAESQIALFSYRIGHLTEHLRVNKKDHVTQRALPCDSERVGFAALGRDVAVGRAASSLAYAALRAEV